MVNFTGEYETPLGDLFEPEGLGARGALGGREGLVGL